MNITTYHVDAFTDQLFSGNPAMVCLLEDWLTDSMLQAIAAENNCPATAYLVQKNNLYYTRWFAPDYEIDLCGHGSLATGYIIFNLLEPALNQTTLHHPKVGTIAIKRENDYIVLYFPIKNFTEVKDQEVLSILAQGLNIEPKEVYEVSDERLLAVLESQDAIKQLRPNIALLHDLKHRGIIVTAKGNQVDFVSRVFYPRKKLSEDAATGSSFCLLAPYWQKQLNKNHLSAQQLSPRGAEIKCHISDHQIAIFGKAILYQRGEIKL